MVPTTSAQMDSRSMDTSLELDESSENEGEQSESIDGTKDSTRDDCEFDVDSECDGENELSSDDKKRSIPPI